MLVWSKVAAYEVEDDEDESVYHVVLSTGDMWACVHCGAAFTGREDMVALGEGLNQGVTIRNVRRG